MLLPQWVYTTAENPERREAKSLRMDYKPTCLPSALEGDIVCHSGPLSFEDALVALLHSYLLPSPTHTPLAD